jgi:hypothetical protein
VAILWRFNDATGRHGDSVIADLALLLAVPAYLIALAAVVLLAVRRSALRGARPRRCPRHGAGAR